MAKKPSKVAVAEEKHGYEFFGPYVVAQKLEQKEVNNADAMLQPRRLTITHVSTPPFFSNYYPKISCCPPAKSKVTIISRIQYRMK